MESILINPDKIEEWMREVEQRPSSAPLIIRYIASRLEELTRRNEELRAENIALVSEKKVEEYESRIASLEYQLGLLKRQVSGGAPGMTRPAEPAAPETLSLVVFTPAGLVLRVEMPPDRMASSGVMANFHGVIAPDGIPPGLLVTSTQEELLFVFDIGRTAALPVTGIPALNPQSLDWEQAFLQEPRASEELAAVLPISRMSLYEFCIQTSRKGFVKKIREPSLETYIANAYLGTGVIQRSDKMCSLVFGSKQDRFGMVSQQGYFFSMDVECLPVAIEEVMKLDTGDYIVSTFILGKKPSLMIATQTGKAVLRDAGWLEQAGSFKTKGQAVLSRERRDSGVRIVGAAAVDENDWGLVLKSDGDFMSYKMSDLFATGSLLPGQAPAQILGFTTFRLPGQQSTAGTSGTPGASRGEH
jgi:DNA gyrase/topoisomerase IV subunit A